MSSTLTASDAAAAGGAGQAGAPTGPAPERVCYSVSVPRGFRYDRAEARLNLQAHVNAVMPSPAGAWKHEWQPTRDLYRVTSVPPLPFPALFDPALVRPWREDDQDPWLPVGVTHDGEPVGWHYTREGQIHGLLSGQTGAGKTVSGQVIVVGALLAGFERVIVLDPKAGADWAWLQRYPRVDFAADLPAMTKALQRAESLRERRSRAQLKAAAAWQPEPVYRPVLVYVDEAAALYTRSKIRGGLSESDDNMRSDCSRYTKLVASQARSVNVHLLIATQRPRADYFDSDTKFNLGFRIGLGELDGTAAKMIFDTTEPAGDRALDDFAPPIEHPGHGYCSPGKGLIELQGYKLTRGQAIGLLGQPPEPEPERTTPAAPAAPAPATATPAAPSQRLTDW